MGQTHRVTQKAGGVTVSYSQYGHWKNRWGSTIVFVEKMLAYY